MSKFKNVIPMSVPRVGGINQPQVDANQLIKYAKYKQCVCGFDYFDKVFKVGVISDLAPGNNTRQDIQVEGAVFVCHKCGEELNPLEKVGDIEKEGKKDEQ